MPSVSAGNVSSTASASTNANSDSPITAAAGTAQTSLRSIYALVASPVRRSTDGNGFIKVEIGFIATRTTIG